MPTYTSLEEFWACMGEQPQPGSEIGEKRFHNIADLCKILLVLPHSTADPERLFTMVGKVDTSQRSSLLPSTVWDILSVKDQKCYQSNELFTPELIAQAMTAARRSLSTANMSQSEQSATNELL